MTPENILQKYWGYTSFKPLQKEVISSVLDNKDTLAIMPTGGGKSLTYQVPTLLRKGICLVIEPLISLIKDQIDNLEKVGIKAVSINHLQAAPQNETALNQCYSGRVKFLFVAAERINSKDFEYHLRNLPISLVVIDEAHCISAWGRSFRPSYRSLSTIRDIIPKVKFLALTATATQKVQNDIIESLKLQEPSVFRGSFYRENIYLKVELTLSKIERAAEIINKINACGIIYCLKRVDSVNIANTLKERYNISAAFYNANMTAYEREKTQNDWISGKTKVLVATTAFGMGINKSDVRFVIHLDIPSNIESFYQEFGRCGRDGKRAYSIVLYNERDLRTQSIISQYSYPNRKIIENVYKKLCNDYKISFFSGKGERFAFNFDDFVHSLNFNIVEVKSALKILQNEGWVKFARDINPQAKIKILLENNELNKFLNQYEVYLYIFEVLLRRFPTIRHEEVSINQYQMALYGHVSENQVEKDLSTLNQHQVISYQPKIHGDYVVFLKDRPFLTTNLLSKELYEQPRKSTIEKAQQMRSWVSSNACRWQQILKYFNQASSKCHNCDNCQK